MIKVETYKIDRWKEKETGLLLAENEDCILVKHIPVDYVVDGYKVYFKKHIISRECLKKEEKVELVLSLKKVKTTKPKEFKFGKPLELLKWVEKKYGLFEFQDESETELFYGTINSVSKNSLVINMIKSDGTIEYNYDYEFNLRKIRSITFLTDYFDSIRLLMEHEKRKKE